MPKPTGTCPGFADGAGCTSDATSLICTFSPATIEPRPVRIWISDAARKKPGPLVTFWHGLSRNAGDAVLPAAGLGPDVVTDIVAKGGIVAAPERSEKRMTTSVSELPLADGARERRARRPLVMDEVVACAIQEVGIDLRHIHTTGMSAGGLQTGAITALAFGLSGEHGRLLRRSARACSTSRIPKTTIPVMLFSAVPTTWSVLNFSRYANQYHTALVDSGHFAVLCDHGMGHQVPADAALPAGNSCRTHPYGVTPEP